MNNFFSFKRFSLLVLKHWADNKKRYSLSLLAYFGLLICWFVFGMLISENYFIPTEVQYPTFFFSLFLVGTFYASQYYSDLSSKAKGGHFLLVPASTFEKFLCSLFYTVIIFSVLITAAFYIVDGLMVMLANSFLENETGHKSTLVNVFKVELMRYSPDIAIYLFLFFFSVQSLFLLGSVYFKKYNFIKTIITGFVVVLLFFSLVFLAHEHLLPEKEDDFYFDKIEKWFPRFLQVAAYIIAPLSWVRTYFILKAKQV